MSLPTQGRDYVTFKRRELGDIKKSLRAVRKWGYISEEKVEELGVGFLGDAIQAQDVWRYKISQNEFIFE